MTEPFKLLIEMDHLRGILVENRLDFLRTKYVPLLHSYLEKLYMSSNRDDQRQYMELLSRATDDMEINQEAFPAKAFAWIVSLDPDANKRHSQWLLNTFLKGEWPPEDGYKATGYLTVFDRMQRQLPVEQRDLNRVKDLHALFDIIEPYMQARSQRQVSRDYEASMHEQARVVFNDSRYKIVAPLTQAASCHFGVNTQWCTAAENDNAFDSHYEQGDLYIILLKASNRRWQFHFETQQFMDETDSSINVAQFIKAHPTVARFFEQLDQENLLASVKHLTAYKTSRGFIIKTHAGLRYPVLGHFIIENEVVTPQHSRIWSYDKVGPLTLALLLNKIGVKGDPEGTDLNGVYYRHNKWGTIAQVGDVVTTVEVEGSITGQWKVVEQPERDQISAASRFCLVNGTKPTGYVANNLAGQLLIFATGKTDDENHPLHSIELHSLYMPLIQARPDITYWHAEFCEFDKLYDADKEWLLKNRPLMLTPAYAYEHLGDCEVTRKIIKHWVESAGIHPMSNPLKWVGDKLLVERHPSYPSPAQNVVSRYKSSLNVWRNEGNRVPFVYHRDGQSYRRGYVEGGDNVLLIPLDAMVKLLSKDIKYYSKGSWGMLLQPMFRRGA